MATKPAAFSLLCSKFFSLFQSSATAAPKKNLLFDQLSPLPSEILQIILQHVGQPARTSLVNSVWKDLSRTSAMYVKLFQQYAGYPALRPFLPPALPSPPRLIAEARQVYDKVAQALNASLIASNRSNETQLDVDQVAVLEAQTDLLDPEFLAQLIKLRDLLLCYSSLVRFRVVVGMPRLDLKDLDIVSATAAMEKDTRENASAYSHITTLDLSHRGLTYLTPCIGQLSNLTSLDIRGCRLTTMPDSMKNLSALREVALDQHSLPWGEIQKLCRQLPTLRIVAAPSGSHETIGKWLEKEFPQLQTSVIDEETCDIEIDLRKDPSFLG
jgi:hypothetical protein